MWLRRPFYARYVLGYTDFLQAFSVGACFMPTSVGMSVTGSNAVCVGWGGCMLLVTCR